MQQLVAVTALRLLLEEVVLQQGSRRTGEPRRRPLDTIRLKWLHGLRRSSLPYGCEMHLLNIHHAWVEPRFPEGGFWRSTPLEVQTGTGVSAAGKFQHG
jgi:hypothetical protein